MNRVLLGVMPSFCQAGEEGLEGRVVGGELRLRSRPHLARTRGTEKSALSCASEM